MIERLEPHEASEVLATCVRSMSPLFCEGSGIICAGLKISWLPDQVPRKMPPFGPERLTATVSLGPSHIPL